MTPEDWKEVKERLEDFYSTVKLKCDGYEVILLLGRISQMENAILIYINGEVKGKWLINDCEERRRFMRPVKKSVFSQKQRTQMKTISKKLRQKYGLPDPNASITAYYPYWTSFNSLKRHLIKHNDSIELVRENC